MDATAHLVVGAALGRKANPVLAFVLGVASNAVLDYIPHTNYTGWRPFTTAMLIDVVIGGLLVLAVMRQAPRPAGAAAGALGGAFPELERILRGQARDFLGRPPLEFPQTEIGPPWGIVTQVVVVLAALLFALRREPARAAASGDAETVDG